MCGSGLSRKVVSWLLEMSGPLPFDYFICIRPWPSLSPSVIFVPVSQPHCRFQKKTRTLQHCLPYQLPRIQPHQVGHIQEANSLLSHCRPLQCKSPRYALPSIFHLHNLADADTVAVPALRDCIQAPSVSWLAAVDVCAKVPQVLIARYRATGSMPYKREKRISQTFGAACDQLHAVSNAVETSR